MYETTAKEGSMKRTWKGNPIVWAVFLLPVLLLTGVSVMPLSARELEAQIWRNDEDV